jgi:hypothetical protein
MIFGAWRQSQTSDSGGSMRISYKALIGAVALAALIASLAGLWRVLVENAEMRLTGGMLTDFARQHPPKPWKGFNIAILDVAVKGEVHITAHVSGYRIHTPVEVIGEPEFDAAKRAVFFHVTETKLPRDPMRPMLSRLNAMLNPLGTYIAQNVTDIIPAKRIKPETRSAILLTTVQSVRVDGDAVVVEFQSHRVAAVAGALSLLALISGCILLALWFRAKPAKTAPVGGSVS